MAFPSLKGTFVIFFIAFLQQTFGLSSYNGNQCQQMSMNNGNIKYLQYNGMQKFSFSCTNGFSPVGKTMSMCMNGQWSNPNPSCIDQSSIRTIENGYMTLSGNTYIIKCNSGFTLVGNEQVSPDFTNLATCVKANTQVIVPQVQYIENLYLENGKYTKTGNMYVASCNDGYVLIGTKAISHIVPGTTQCVRADSYHAFRLDNGIAQASENGYTYTFQCNQGFSLKGDQQIRYVNNKWTGLVPLCLPINTVPATQNVHSYEITQTVQQTIPSVQNVVPSVQNIVPSVQNIVPSVQNIVPSVQNVAPINVVPSVQNIPTANVVHSVHNFQIVPYEITQTVQQTIPSVQNVVPSVQNIVPSVQTIAPSCSALTLLNGDVSYNEIFKSATFTCKVGYSLMGSAQSVCENGKWTTATPVCVPECPAFNFENGFWQKIQNTQTVRFGCNSGFELQGNSESTCNYGQWSHPVPICIATCQTPKIDNGVVQASIDSKTVQFQCNNGYILNGSSQISCNGGQWSAVVPTCVPLCQAVAYGITVTAQQMSVGCPY